MHESMLENGLDFILDAANLLKNAEDASDAEEKEKALKYSMLHLSSGIELMMKFRLYIDNWTYIFADMNKADKHKLNSGDLITVDYERCIERLYSLCNVKISDNNKRYFKSLRVNRNKIEHFITDASTEAIEASINNALTATLVFLQENYEYISFSTKNLEIRELTEKEKNLISEIVNVVSYLQRHREEAIKLAIEQTKEVCLESDLVECPSCGERVMVIDDKNNNCHCYMCGYEETGEEAAKEYLFSIEGIDEYSTIKDGAEYPLYVCPECGKISLLKRENQYICFSCRMVYSIKEIQFCIECGNPYWVSNEELKEDLGFCPNCLEYKIEKH